MAGSSLFALIDDIATLLDDVSVMTKVAAKKTAGVLGDDLALNAQQVHGIRAERELPVVFAVAKGSAVNKLILVPLALLISAFAEQLITPLLMLGGLYLCFEGVEKLAHKFLHHDSAEDNKLIEAFLDKDVDMVAFEKDKIKGAVRTDFILSAEIIVITLGTIPAGETFINRLSVLTLIAIVMTIGVYGIVAAIIKLDDIGFYLETKKNQMAQVTARALIAAAPKIMRFLSVAGTVAMFMVGGSILMHGLHDIHLDALANLSHIGQNLAFPLNKLASIGVDITMGIIAGTVVLLLVMLFSKIKNKITA